MGMKGLGLRFRLDVARKVEGLEDLCRVWPVLVRSPVPKFLGLKVSKSKLP